MFLVPLAAFLLVSRPATWAEISCLIVTAGISAGLLALSRGIASQTANALAVFLAGGYIVQGNRGHESEMTRAVRALSLALLALVVWCVVWGIGWNDVEFALTRRWWAWCRNLSAVAYLLDLSPGIRDFLDRLANGGRTYARIYPLWLAATGLMGLMLAGFWHRRITGKLDHL